MVLPIDAFMEEGVLPNYEAECMKMVVALASTFFFWVVFFPYFISKLLFQEQVLIKQHNENNQKKKTESVKTKETIQRQTGNAKQRRGKAKKISSPKKQEASPVETKAEEKQFSTLEVPLSVNVFSSVACIFSIVYVAMVTSPYNRFVARGVFQAPILTADECHHLVNISMRVAQDNLQTALKAQQEAKVSGQPLDRSTEGLLWEPQGWQKLRHKSYPTTDLNIITDPFAKDDLQWLQEKLDARLSPTLSRIYGIPESAIRANDMFVVRYDSDYRAFLSNHTDDADISINILLTEDFEGGGTQFWNRVERAPFAHVKPKKIGQMLTHSALINHVGMPTTNGTRIIFVGFLSVDRVDPFTLAPTGLSTYASWMSLPWISTKFKEAYSAASTRIENGLHKWTNNKYMMALFLDLANVLQLIGDFHAPHHVENLVSEENAAKYLQNLDDAYREKQASKEAQAKASWFKGQQINIDIDGSISTEWNTRSASKNRFMEL